MNRQRFPRERDPHHESRDDLRDYRGVQRDAYGRYDEDDWQPREPRDDWGYGDSRAERGPAAPYYGGRGDGTHRRTADAQRGDYAAHYGSERGQAHQHGYYGRGVDSASAAWHPGRGGFGSAARGGYAETVGPAAGSGAGGRPRGRPGEDFRGYGPRGYVRSDERLRELIADRLTDDPLIDAGDIEIGVLDGRVSLSGTVDRRQTRHRVEDLVDACGAREIDNRLRVGPAHDTGTGVTTNRTPPETT